MTNNYPTRPGYPWRVIAHYPDGTYMYQSHHRTHAEAVEAAAHFRARPNYLGIKFGSVIVTDGAR